MPPETTAPPVTQTTETTTQEPAAPPAQDRGADFHGPSRDELVAAAESAMKAESDAAAAAKPPPAATTEPTKDSPKASPDRGANGRFQPKNGAEVSPKAAPAGDKAAAKTQPNDQSSTTEPAAAEEEDEEGLPKLERVLRAREKAQQGREGENAQREATRLLEETRAKAQGEATRIIEEARRKADEEYNARLGKLKDRPLEAIKAIGWDPQRLVDEVTREGTPEWRAQKAYEAKLHELEQKTKGYDDYVAAQKAAEEQAKAAHASQVREHVEQRFFREHATAEKAPSLTRLYEPAEILTRAYEVAAKISAATGSPPSDEELVQYLEHHASKKLAALFQQAGAGTQFQEAGAGGAVHQARTPKPGSRTLSASSASERRAAPRPLSEMTAEEARAELAAVADEAIRAAAR